MNMITALKPTTPCPPPAGDITANCNHYLSFVTKFFEKRGWGDFRKGNKNNPVSPFTKGGIKK
jgi:hypothetical protein